MTDLSVTYDELLADPPDGWTIAQHAAFAVNGVLVVDAPGLEAIVVKPDQQLNYRCNEEGHVVAYSCGPIEEAPPSTPEPVTDGSDGAPRTEPPAPSEPEPSEPDVSTPQAEVEDAIEKADAHLKKAKPAVGSKGATK